MNRNAGMKEIVWRAVGVTNQGMVRKNNEDAYYCDDEQGLYIVIDGMGGHRAGEIAAKIALECLIQNLTKEDKSAASERIRSAIITANNSIIDQSEENAEWRNMQCVLTVVLVERNHIVIGHVGDTRLYIIDDNSIRKVTHDHSPAGILEDKHHMSELEAMLLPNRNEVYRSLGAEHIEVDNDEFVEIIKEPIKSNQSILICSDGLSDCLTSQHIREIVTKHILHPSTVINKLIQAANNAGGKDNITVVFAQHYSDNQKRVSKSNRLLTNVFMLCVVSLLIALVWSLNRPPHNNNVNQLPKLVNSDIFKYYERIDELAFQANIYREQKEYNKSLEMYNCAIQHPDKTGQLYYERALVHKELKMADKVVKDLKTAIMLKTDNTDAINEYCKFIKEVKDKSELQINCSNNVNQTTRQ